MAKINKAKFKNLKYTKDTKQTKKLRNDELDILTSGKAEPIKYITSGGNLYFIGVTEDRINIQGKTDKQIQKLVTDKYGV